MAEVPTPPGSNKPEDDKNQKIWPNTNLNSMSVSAACTPGMFLGHAELSSMFPTPPSHERQEPMQSPCPDGLLSSAVSAEPDLSLVKMEQEDGPGSVPGYLDNVDINIQMSPESPDVNLNNPFKRFMVDLSPVFEPNPTISFVGSSKYMPLTTMPSQLSPLPSYASTLVYRPVSVNGSDSASNSG